MKIFRVRVIDLENEKKTIIFFTKRNSAHTAAKDAAYQIGFRNRDMFKDSKVIQILIHETEEPHDGTTQETS